MKPSASLLTRAALLAGAVVTMVLAGSVQGQQGQGDGKGLTDAMRGSTPLASPTRPPIMFPTENKDIRRSRNYTMQPPTIPHKIDDYQVDKNYNRCMACHARTKVEETQAIPISITHYMDRDNNVLADVSPRRYFCTQCHVPQADAKPLVTNTFTDVEQLLKRKPGKPGTVN